MSENSVVDSLPDRSMKQSEVDELADSDGVDWTEPLRTGSPKHQGVVHAWILETDGTAHVLHYELDGWVSKESFATEGLSSEEKRERGDEALDL